MDFTSWLFLLISIVAGLIGALYLYLSSVFTYWKKRGVPYIEPSFPAGNVLDLVLSRKSFGEVFNEFYKKLSGEKFGGVYLFHNPSLLLMDPELIKNFLVKDFDHFHDHGFEFDENVDPLSANLFMINGEKWKKLRHKLSPTFTSGKMKMMFQCLVDCGQELEKYLEDPAKKGDVLEVKDVLARFTTDIIASCAFGIQCNCLKNPDAEFRLYGKKTFERSFDRNMRDLLYSLFPSLAIALKISNTGNDVTRFFTKIVKETVEYREKNNVKRNDFMQLLIQLKNQGRIEGDEDTQKTENITKLSMVELTAQAFIFFIGGFETSSTTMSFCLYELALNPEIQKKVREEINTVLQKHGGKVTYEAILEMSYLDKTVSETLRKYPPIPILNRECNKDYKIPNTDFVVEKGTPIVIPIMAIQYDPRYFPDPEKFDPERFSEEIKNQRHHYTYLPFGEGPRMCIGMRFGLMQTKVGLASVLSNYEVNVSNETPIPMVYEPLSFFPTPVGGMKLKITTAK